jgi:hypothetical protein
MGNSSSGRTGGFPTSEGCASFILTMRPFRDALRSGVAGCYVGTLTYRSWSEDMELAVTLDTTYRNAVHVVLKHATRNADDTEQRYRVDLESTPQPFGGLRWWFLCPRSGRTVSKLYLPRGAYRFASRQAYRLGYACQREGRMDRIQRQGMKRYAALGGEGNWLDEAPPKPKGMRWRTYQREVARLEECWARFDSTWTVSAARFLKHFGRL